MPQTQGIQPVEQGGDVAGFPGSEDEEEGLPAQGADEPLPALIEG